jgi:hypothetical protein
MHKKLWILGMALGMSAALHAQKLAKPAPPPPPPPKNALAPAGVVRQVAPQRAAKSKALTPPERIKARKLKMTHMPPPPPPAPRD